MNLALDHPAALLLLLGCIPPLLGRGTRWLAIASIADAPPDAVSACLDAALRLLVALPIAALALGLAGLHQRQQTVQHTGTGAHIIVVLDRSLSMDEPFALRGEKATETKTAAAARMIADFFARRPHDRFGLVAFSTAPIVAMPLTDHRAALAAAIAAMRGKGLGNTDIGAGIAMALSQFARDDAGAVRVIVLVTDGGGEIPEQVRLYIHSEFARIHAHLYYLYLRAGDDPALGEGTGDENLDHPAGLDGFFRTLNVPYAAFEARDVGAIAAATRRIGDVETHPLIYREVVPRRDLDRLCYLAAAICLCLGLFAQLAERGLNPPSAAPAE